MRTLAVTYLVISSECILTAVRTLIEWHMVNGVLLLSTVERLAQ